MKSRLVKIAESLSSKFTLIKDLEEEFVVFFVKLIDRGDFCETVYCYNYRTGIKVYTKLGTYFFLICDKNTVTLYDKSGIVAASFVKRKGAYFGEYNDSPSEEVLDRTIFNHDENSLVLRRQIFYKEYSSHYFWVMEQTMLNILCTL